MISACLIVKNEEQNLFNCLKSLSGFVDEIIVADTGSTDKTIEIAEYFNCNIVHYQWINDFSSARNFAKQFAKCEFILSIDADEILINGNELRNICYNSKNYIGGYIVNIISSKSNNKLNLFSSPQVRLFRNLPNINFRGLVHEQITDSIQESGYKIEICNLNILHTGYDTSKEKIFEKYHRNLRLIDIELSRNESEYYLLHKARTLSALESFDDAEKILNKLISKSVDKITKIESFNILGNQYLTQKKLYESENIFFKSFQLDNNQIFVINQLSNLNFFLNNYTKSLIFIDLLESKIENTYNFSGQPIINRIEIIFKKSKLLLILKEYSKALEYLDFNYKYIEMDADILFLYANALFKNQNYLGALEQLNKAKNLGLNNPELDETIKKIENLINSNKSEVLLSLCMIVKNEEKYLEGCLESVRNIVDEIIIVDTGSTDNTIEIAKKYTSNIHYFQWINDFSAARNESIKYASGKWILYLDADERLILHNPRTFKELLINADSEIGGINCIIESEVKNISGESEIQTSFYQRIFRNYQYPNVKFEGKVHEQILHSLEKLGKSIINSDIIVKHLGYNSEQKIINEKVSRNLILLEESYRENPDDGYVMFHLGQSFIMTGDYQNAKIMLEKSLNSKNVSDSIRASSLNILAQFAGIESDFDKALFFAEKSLLLVENQELGLAIKAEALRKLGRLEESLETFESLLFYKRNKPAFVEIGFDNSISETKIISVISSLKNKIKN
jgi:glycosyltransferase involved in cell wall biosynthesis